MTSWRPILTAPRDGMAVRVRVRDTRHERGQTALRELPWLLYFDGGRWRYASTGAPIHSWHAPYEWTSEPRTEIEATSAELAIAIARGSEFLPSQYPKGIDRPALMVVGGTAVRS